MKEERERWAKLQEIAAREEEELARGAGSCLLRRPGANAVVANALRYFDGTRYALFAYVIMPNHVHVMLRPAATYSVSGILHSWKSFTAKKFPGATGSVWQSEFYDHLVRGDRDFAAQLRYIQLNPERAGLTGGYELWTASNLDDLWFANEEEQASSTCVSPVEEAPDHGSWSRGGICSLHRRDADATCEDW